MRVCACARVRVVVSLCVSLGLAKQSTCVTAVAVSDVRQPQRSPSSIVVSLPCPRLSVPGASQPRRKTLETKTVTPSLTWLRGQASEGWVCPEHVQTSSMSLFPKLYGVTTTHTAIALYEVL